MAINIVVNRNLIGKNTGKKEIKKDSFRQKMASSERHIAYSKASQKLLDGDLAIIVGRVNIESEKVKAVPVPFVTSEEHRLYYWNENEHPDTRIGMPKNIQSLTPFVGPVRVYTNSGLILTVQAEEHDQISVFRTENLLFIRVGEPMNQIIREKKSKQLAQMGIWKA